MAANLIQLKQGLSEQQLKVLELELDRRKKSTPLAYALWFFLSWIGLHKFYLEKTGAGIAYIFLPWAALLVFLGGLVTSGQDGGALALAGMAALVVYVVWWFIDLFTLHSQVEKLNEQIEAQIIRSIQTSTR